VISSAFCSIDKKNSNQNLFKEKHLICRQKLVVWLFFNTSVTVL